MSTNAGLLLAALLLDSLLGDPKWLWQRVPHPAALMGMCVGFFDKRLNANAHRYFKGSLTIALLGGLAAGLGLAVERIPDGGLTGIILGAILLAHHSLITHVTAVARGLEKSLAEGQNRVAGIVGRDPETLDQAGVIRAAIESLAENFSDGVVAPAFWYLVAGLPGILVYKMVNTADSMIGYRSAHYAEFGWAAARLDDVLNYVPARLSGFLIAATHLSRRSFRIMWRDASLHRSPNAGWPEAATAAILGIAISGPRVYDGKQTTDPFVNAEGRRELIPQDIDAAVRAIWRAWCALVGGLIILVLI